MPADHPQRFVQIGRPAAEIMAVRTQELNLVTLQHPQSPGPGTGTQEETGIGLNQNGQLLQPLGDAVGGEQIQISVNMGNNWGNPPSGLDLLQFRIHILRPW